MKDIVLSGIGKSFGEKEVLKNVSAVFPAGRASCISAPSGAGKTTLLRLIMGLERPDSGKISGLEGVVMSAVFQEDRLCEGLTAAGNIKLVSPGIPEREIAAAMEQVGLTGCGGQPVGELSGGMRRRVAVLRAVLYGGDLLLLDEPFKGLDNAAKQKLAAVIKSRFAQKTVILVTHDAAEAEALGCLYRLELL